MCVFSLSSLYFSVLLDFLIRDIKNISTAAVDAAADAAAAAAAKSLQSCLILCNPIDGSPLGSSVHGIL